MNDTWKCIIVFLIGLFIGFMINSCNTPVKEIPINIHDTITINTERIIEHTDTIYKLDTLLKIDSIVVTKDGTYVQLPMTYYQYKDSFETDSSVLKLSIKHHGVVSEIDLILYSYDYTPTFRCPEEKFIRPFIFIQGGPKLNYSFREINGAVVSAGGGVIFRGGNGIILDYELDAGKEIGHSFKVGYIKLF